MYLAVAMVSQAIAEDASLVGVINDDNHIVLIGSGSEVLALDFASDAGMLVPLPSTDDSPFELLIANTNENVAVGTLGAAVVIDGQLNTGIGYNGNDPGTDLDAIWANADDQITRLPVEFDLPTREPELTGLINLDHQLVLIGDNLNVVGIQIQSMQGLLDPIPPGDLTADASPFAVVLANSPTETTLGNLGSSVFVVGELLTPVRYLGDDPNNDLVAFWGAKGSSEQRSFRITKEVCGGELLADIDRDGEVAFGDFLILSANFGQEVSRNESGDLDCNGEVNFLDFLILSNEFGTTSDVAAVPEPTSAMGWLACILLGVCRVWASQRRTQRAAFSESQFK